MKTTFYNEKFNYIWEKSLVMINKTLCCAVGLAAISFMNAQHNYPKTEKISHTDEYFGTKVEDPYRWLEDDMSQNTKNWVKSEVDFTNNYLAKIPFRKDIAKQLKDIWNYEKISAPFKEGDYTYFYKKRTKTEKQKYFLTLINSRLTELLPWQESALIKKETSLLTKSPKEAATGIKSSS